MTHESVQFVQAMQDPEATDADRIQALKACVSFLFPPLSFFFFLTVFPALFRAASKHVDAYRRAMKGGGYVHADIRQRLVLTLTSTVFDVSLSVDRHLFCLYVASVWRVRMRGRRQSFA